MNLKARDIVSDDEKDEDFNFEENSGFLKDLRKKKGKCVKDNIIWMAVLPMICLWSED